MARRTNRRTSLAVLAAAGLVLAGCGGEGGSTEENGAGATGPDVELVTEGKLTVCTQLPYEPFEYRQGDEIVGFDIDLMEELANDLGVEVAVVDTPFEGIQSGEDLNARKCDIAAAGMTITEQRAQRIAFSEPYFDATQALLVRTDGEQYSSLDELVGRTLGVQTGTTGELYAKENAPQGVTIRSFEDLALLLTAVKTGQIDAAINDNGVLYDFVKDNPDVAVTTEFDTGEQYGFGLRKNGSGPLLEATNAMLEEVRENGRYDEIYQKWFGTTPGAGGGASPSGTPSPVASPGASPATSPGASPSPS